MIMEVVIAICFLSGFLLLCGVFAQNKKLTFAAGIGCGIILVVAAVLFIPDKAVQLWLISLGVMTIGMMFVLLKQHG
jgi:hypothetical protein